MPKETKKTQKPQKEVNGLKGEWLMTKKMGVCLAVGSWDRQKHSAGLIGTVHAKYTGCFWDFYSTYFELSKNSQYTAQDRILLPRLIFLPYSLQIKKQFSQKTGMLSTSIIQIIKLIMLNRFWSIQKLVNSSLWPNLLNLHMPKYTKLIWIQKWLRIMLWLIQELL